MEKQEKLLSKQSQKLSLPTLNKDALQGERAHALYLEIIQRRNETAYNILRIGELLLKIKDEKLYEFLGYDTFKSFYCAPEIGFAESTVYMFTRLYELYIIKLGKPPEMISGIPIGKLQVINPVVDQYPDEADEWLHKATHLSKKDLIDEVRERQNKPPMEIKKKEVSDAKLIDFKTYLRFVKAHPCVIHPTRPSDPHHFPRTKGAGEIDWHRLPLCRECHTAYHLAPSEFLWQFRVEIFNYFYDVIAKAYTIIANFGGVQ